MINYWKNMIKFVEKSQQKHQKKLSCKRVYNKKYLKSKIKSYNGKINTNFYNNEIPKEGSQCIWLSAILVYSVYRKDKNSYPQVF